MVGVYPFGVLGSLRIQSMNGKGGTLLSYGYWGTKFFLASASLSGWGEQSTEPPYSVQKWNFPIILLDPVGGLGRSAMCCVGFG